jgi:hypothetical protein
MLAKSRAAAVHSHLAATAHDYDDPDYATPQAVLAAYEFGLVVPDRERSRLAEVPVAQTIANRSAPAPHPPPGAASRTARRRTQPA